MGTTHLGAPGGPGTPWWVVPPSGHPPGAALAHRESSSPKKSPKSFALFGLRLILISPRWVVPTSVASRTPSLHYKFPNILKPFGVNLDQKFRRCKVFVYAKTNLDLVLAPCQRGESSPVAIFIIPAATTMRRE